MGGHGFFHIAERFCFLSQLSSSRTPALKLGHACVC